MIQYHIIFLHDIYVEHPRYYCLLIGTIKSPLFILNNVKIHPTLSQMYDVTVPSYSRLQFHVINGVSRIQSYLRTIPTYLSALPHSSQLHSGYRVLRSLVLIVGRIFDYRTIYCQVNLYTYRYSEPLSLTVSLVREFGEPKMAVWCWEI